MRQVAIQACALGPKAHKGLLAEVHRPGDPTHTLDPETSQKRRVAGDSHYFCVYKKSAFCGTCAKWPYRHAHWGQKRIQVYWLMFIIQTVPPALYTLNLLNTLPIREIVTIFAYIKNPPFVAHAPSGHTGMRTGAK